MTPPRSVIGTITSLSWLARFRTRALVFGLLILLFAVLAVFPQHYRAATTLTPSDPQSLGLSGTLGQLGAMNGVFTNQASIEVALRVGNSANVRDLVIKRLRLNDRLAISDRGALHRWLDRHVTVRSLRGGIISIEMKELDQDLARDIVSAYAAATQERLAEISRTQTAYKRNVLEQLVANAGQQLATAQAAYDDFRLRNRNPTPDVAFSAVSQRIPGLENRIKGKEIELAAAQQVYGEDNNAIRQMKTEIAQLRQQVLETQSSTKAGDSVGRAVEESSQLFKLQRELQLARTLYDSYLRFLQGTTVENLTSTANVRILEPAFVDTERQVWWPAASVALALLLLWLAIEFYRLRPPLGARLSPEEQHG